MLPYRRCTERSRGLREEEEEVEEGRSNLRRKKEKEVMIKDSACMPPTPCPPSPPLSLPPSQLSYRGSLSGGGSSNLGMEALLSYLPIEGREGGKEGVRKE